MLHKITQPHIYLLILPQHITILTLLSPHLNIYKTAFYSLHRVSYLSIAPLYVLVHQQCGHRVQEPAENDMNSNDICISTEQDKYLNILIMC